MEVVEGGGAVVAGSEFEGGDWFDGFWVLLVDMELDVEEEAFVIASNVL